MATENLDEDMQLVCNHLLETLQATRGGCNVVNLIYADGPLKETVTMVFMSGRKQTINVTGDSGMTMIYDIMKYFRR